jgi:hypothetical protein
MVGELQTEKHSTEAEREEGQISIVVTFYTIGCSMQLRPWWENCRQSSKTERLLEKQDRSASLSHK